MSGPFLTSKDIATLKKVEAIRNSQIKRGERKRRGNEQDQLAKDFFNN